MNKSMFIDHDGTVVSVPLLGKTIIAGLRRTSGGYIGLVFCGRNQDGQMEYWHLKEVFPGDTIKVGVTDGGVPMPPPIPDQRDALDLDNYYSLKYEYDGSPGLYSDIPNLGIHIDTVDGEFECLLKDRTATLFATYSRGEVEVRLGAMDNNTFYHYTWYVGMLDSGQSFDVEIKEVEGDSEQIKEFSYPMKTMPSTNTRNRSLQPISKFCSTTVFVFSTDNS